VRGRELNPEITKENWGQL